MDLPPCPATLKSIQHYLKIAQEHIGRDIVVAYWSRLYALQVGLKLSNKAPDESALLIGIMDWLEQVKKQETQNEAITNEVAAQAHLENYALKLFLYADKQDREGNFGKNVVKAFYSSGVIYDVLQTFGELTDEVLHNRKYAKWKAAYIHNCLKNGETPIPGPMSDEGFDDDGNTTAPTDAGATDDTNNDNDDDDITAVPQDPPKSITPQSPTSPSMGFHMEPTPMTPPSPDASVQPLSPPPSYQPTTPPTAFGAGGAGGFAPYEQPAAPVQPQPPIYTPTPPVAAPVAVGNVHITNDQMFKAQKYCKYAGSALNYDDVKTAIENLQKALTLLTTGRDG